MTRKHRNSFKDDFTCDATFDYFGNPRRFAPGPSRGTSDPQTSLQISPHYSDERYSRGQTHTLYCKRGEELLPGSCDTHHVEGAHYVYSDRLWGWDNDKMRRANAEAKEAGHPVDSADYFSAMMSIYEGKKIEVVHVTAGVNVSNGYSYYVLGYREVA